MINTPRRGMSVIRDGIVAIFDAYAFPALVIGLLVWGAFATLSCAHAAEICVASWYGAESGRQTASGERFHPEGISCAHKSRAFGSVVTVTLLTSGRSISCRINDRGPFIRGRCIDLSHGAARALGMGGTARVSIQ